MKSLQIYIESIQDAEIHEIFKVQRSLYYKLLAAETSFRLGFIFLVIFIKI